MRDEGRGDARRQQEPPVLRGREALQGNPHGQPRPPAVELRVPVGRAALDPVALLAAAVALVPGGRRALRGAAAAAKAPAAGAAAAAAAAAVVLPLEHLPRPVLALAFQGAHDGGGLGVYGLGGGGVGRGGGGEAVGRAGAGRGGEGGAALRGTTKGCPGSARFGEARVAGGRSGRGVG